MKRFNISKISKPCFDRKAANNGHLSRLATLAVSTRKSTVLKEAKPYIKNGAELVIPMDAPDKYRWWAEGQSVLDTLLELNAANNVIEKYIGEITTPDDWRRWQMIQHGAGITEKK